MSEFVVVGAGVMGAATARALARQGREVVLLERFALNHDRGSSHGTSRIFRFSYHEERYVRMAMESLPLWRELEDETGTDLLTITGGLDLGAALMDDHIEALGAAGAAFEVLDAAAVGERFPHLRVQPGERALFQPDSGFVLAEASVAAMAASAVKHGADLREETTVRELRRSADGVEVVTDAETFRPSVVVVTAGGWGRGLLEGVDYALPVTPTLETVAFFDIPTPVFPTLIDWRTPPFYSLPSPGRGLKVGEFRVGPVIDPDAADRVPSEESIAHMSAWVAERWRGADPRPTHAEACIYTNTPDEHFVLDRDGPVVVGSPCSGHGFKFAPWIGQRLAELAMQA